VTATAAGGGSADDANEGAHSASALVSFTQQLTSHLTDSSLARPLLCSALIRAVLVSVLRRWTLGASQALRALAVEEQQRQAKSAIIFPGHGYRFGDGKKVKQRAQSSAAQADRDAPPQSVIQVPPGVVGARRAAEIPLPRSCALRTQAGRQWNHTLAQALRECGYQECTEADRCVFTKLKRARSGRLLYLCTYVDDMPYAY